MNPEHPKSGHAILDGPIDSRDLVDDATRQRLAKVIEKSGAGCGVRHLLMMPNTTGSCEDGGPEHRPIAE